ncbi:MAG: 3-deoxy-D-manno-octulosonic acid transferase [Bacteroidetes bacterium]|nr:3-deoxy-D-manno-octulosonic acid transferase [Bacteroidota bacterium]
MSLFLYNVVVGSYFLAIRLAAFWNEKTRLWVAGRKDLLTRLEDEISSKRIDNQPLVWVHCASLGEFEQGRPVIEKLKATQPETQVLLTFFSPSGYEIRKNYPHADWVFYLPADTAANARRFLEIVRPDLAVFVKYEFWYHYLHFLKKSEVPCLLISAVFRPEQPFFQWYGGLHRRMLGCFTKILVQDETSVRLLEKTTAVPVEMAGDTRIDRVLEIAKSPLDLPAVRLFCEGKNVLVCGSTWPADEAVLFSVFDDPLLADWKFIVAPHDVQPAHLQAIEQKIPVAPIRFSALKNGQVSTVRALLIDSVGLLSSLYQFGKIAYVGGGFGKGIHNILEPAAYGIPVVFGSNFQKFEEAKSLAHEGGGFSVENADGLKMVLGKLTAKAFYEDQSHRAAAFVSSNSGATQRVLNEVGRQILKK